MVCDGSERVDEILRSAMLWDVMGGVARRSWARNPHAMETSEAFNKSHAEDYQITNDEYLFNLTIYTKSPLVSYRITIWFMLNSCMFKQFHILWECILSFYGNIFPYFVRLLSHNMWDYLLY